MLNKKEFLDKLRRRLVVLKNEEIDDIIVEYGGYIDEKVKKGKTEAQAIKEFGDIDELVKEILSAYKINDDATTLKNIIMNFFDDMGKLFGKIANDLNEKQPEQLVKFGIEILLLIVIIGIFRLPLELIIHLGKDIFSILPTALYAVIYGIWRFLLELIYIILAVVFFLKVFKERYMSYSSVDDKSSKDIKEKTITKDERTSEVKDEIKKKVPKEESQRTYADDNFAGNVWVIIFKILAAFFLIPSIGAVTGFIVAFGIGIGLIVSGVHYFGYVICLFALLQFGIIIIELLFNFIFDRRVHPLKIFGSLIIAILALGLGSGITVFEVMDTTYINSIHDSFEQKQMTLEYNIDEINNLSTWGHIDYVVDNTLNSVNIKIKYYEEYIKPEISIAGKTLMIKREKITRFIPKKLYQVIIGDLKNKEVYNYTQLYKFNIVVSANEETINKLK